MYASQAEFKKIKPILETQDFQCHEDIHRMGNKYSGLLTSQNISIKSIKKVTPSKMSGNPLAKVKFGLLIYSNRDVHPVRAQGRIPQH